MHVDLNRHIPQKIIQMTDRPINQLSLKYQSKWYFKTPLQIRRIIFSKKKKDECGEDIGKKETHSIFDGKAVWSLTNKIKL